MALPRTDSSVGGTVTIEERSPSDGSKADHPNAVVWLTPAAATARDREVLAGMARQTFLLQQRRKRFLPHVLAVPVGAMVDFPNLDPFFHNVFSLFDGKRFDLGLYEAGTTHSVRFDRPGVCYIFCNIHPEMSAVVVVLSTPYFAVSDRAGEFAIPNVPPGRYILGVWHERSPAEELKEFAREITVPAGGTSLAPIRLSSWGDLLAPHKNKYGRDYDRPSPPGALYENR